MLGARVAEVNPSNPIVALGVHALSVEPPTCPGVAHLSLISAFFEHLPSPRPCAASGDTGWKEVNRIHLWKNSSGRLIEGGLAGGGIGDEINDRTCLS